MSKNSMNFKAVDIRKTHDERRRLASARHYWTTGLEEVVN